MVKSNIQRSTSNIEFSTAHQTLSSLRVQPGLVLSHFNVGRWIGTWMFDLRFPTRCDFMLEQF